MSRLRNRNRQIPGGLRYYVPQTKWQSTPWASFDSIVHSLLIHRRGNPHLARQHGWSLNFDQAANEVDAYNALLCEQNGWTEYIAEGMPGPAPPPPGPKSSPQRGTLRRHAGNLAAGGKTLIDWLGSGGVPVEHALAEKRAATCATCPHNAKGSLTDWFTVPLANAIAKQIEIKNEMKLSTTSDHLIGLCDICSCPTKLKVWTPLEHIVANIPSETLASLPPHCWIAKRDQ